MCVCVCVLSCSFSSYTAAISVVFTNVLRSGYLCRDNFTKPILNLKLKTSFERHGVCKILGHKLSKRELLTYSGVLMKLHF